jgi:ribosomal-protein-alanine N-acetyltransferase
MVLYNEGHSLFLRQTVVEDAPILLRAYQDESFMRLYRSNNTPLTETQLSELLAERAEYSPQEMGYIEFMIEHQQHGPLGIAALSNYSSVHKRAEFQIGLFEKKRRSLGHGTEATLLVLDLAFNAYLMHKIFSYIYDYNKFSHKNMLKFGFQHEGILAEHHYLINEKRFANLYLNGITEPQFRNSETIRRYSWRLLKRDVTQPCCIVQLSADNQLPKKANQQFLEELRLMIDNTTNEN